MQDKLYSRLLTLRLRAVSDSKLPKEAFSIRGTDEAANTVEEQEDVNECQLYAGQLCQHTCVNVWGSYRCDCHQGYVLQQDRHSCKPGTETQQVAHLEPGCAGGFFLVYLYVAVHL